MRWEIRGAHAGASRQARRARPSGRGDPVRRTGAGGKPSGGSSLSVVPRSDKPVDAGGSPRVRLPIESEETSRPPPLTPPDVPFGIRRFTLSSQSMVLIQKAEKTLLAEP